MREELRGDSMAIISRTAVSVLIEKARYLFLPEKTGTSLYVTATNDTAGTVTFAWGTTYTCFFKAKIFSTPSNAARLIAGASGNDYFLMTVTAIQVSHRGSTATSASNYLVINEWHDYCITFDGSLVRFYRDGAPIDAQSMTQTPTSTAQAYTLFNRNDGVRQCDMYVKHFQFYTSRVFDSEEVAAHYRSKPIDTTSLSIWHKYDEGTGTTATDSSGNGKNGTIVGCSWVDIGTLKDNSSSFGDEPVYLQRPYNRDLSACGFTNSLYFDGTQGIIRLPATNVFTGSVTFFCWMYWNGQTGGYQTIFSKRDAYNLANLQFSLNIIANPSSQANYVANDTVASYVNFGSKIPKKKWMTFAWVRNTSDSTEKIYIDGVPLVSKSIGTFGNGTSAVVSIGGTQNPSVDWFNGYMKEVFITLEALNSTQLHKLSMCILPNNSPWAYLKLNEGSGTTATDTSGNGNNGTIDAATWSDFVPKSSVRSSAGTRTTI